MPFSRALERALDSCRAGGTRLLFLDFDGTMAPFSPDASRVRPYAEVVRVLDEIIESGACRVVLVTGRPLDAAPIPLGLRAPVEIWGSHGWQRRLKDGSLQGWLPNAAEREALDLAERRVAPLRSLGARIERKIASVAVHWRGLDAQTVALLRLRIGGAWAAFAPSLRLRLLPFDGGLELSVRGRDKGSAVSTVMAECRAVSAAVYLGDDLTDEDAMAAIAPGGTGVLVRPQWRPTRAAAWLRPPGELVSFLERWRDRVTSPSAAVQGVN